MFQVIVTGCGTTAVEITGRYRVAAEAPHE
jgi:hypothetical protein